MENELFKGRVDYMNKQIFAYIVDSDKTESTYRERHLNYNKCRMQLTKALLLGDKSMFIINEFLPVCVLLLEDILEAGGNDSIYIGWCDAVKEEYDCFIKQQDNFEKHNWWRTADQIEKNKNELKLLCE